MKIKILDFFFMRHPVGRFGQLETLHKKQIGEGDLLTEIWKFPGKTKENVNELNLIIEWVFDYR